MHLVDQVRYFRFIVLSTSLMSLALSCTQNRESLHFCEIFGVAQAYQDTITIEVVTREMQKHDVEMSPSCRTAVDESQEIGYNRLLTGEDISSEGTEIMRLYLEYKNRILDTIINSIG